MTSSTLAKYKKYFLRNDLSKSIIPLAYKFFNIYKKRT